MKTNAERQKAFKDRKRLKKITSEPKEEEGRFIYLYIDEAYKATCMSRGEGLTEALKFDGMGSLELNLFVVNEGGYGSEGNYNCSLYNDNNADFNTFMDNILQKYNVYKSHDRITEDERVKIKSDGCILAISKSKKTTYHNYESFVKQVMNLKRKHPELFRTIEECELRYVLRRKRELKERRITKETLKNFNNKKYSPLTEEERLRQENELFAEFNGEILPLNEVAGFNQHTAHNNDLPVFADMLVVLC